VYPPYFEGTALYAKLPEGSGSSAGGFGTVFEQPAYQKVAVDKYLQKVADAGEFPPKSRGYNTSKRAFPDISAQAKNYCFNAPTSSQMLPASCSSTECLKAAMQTYRCGKGGTSAAAPTLAGIIGQLNAARAKAGKGTLGFLNLLIYQHPEVFNDITQGVPSVACAEHGAGPKKGEPLLDKKSCDKECQDTVVLGKGWPVKEGYDMATGVGTPDYKKLKKLVLSLPGWLP
jgi:tripeptidyl-peptidase-1